MRPLTLLPRALAPALALALGACNGATTPDVPLADAYVLATVDGAGEPLVIADHVYASGLRQVYTLTYDSLRFTSDTAGARTFELAVDTFEGGVRVTPPLRSRFQYATEVSRRGGRVVLFYLTSTGTPLNPDTLAVRGDDLVRIGTYGVVCGECPPLRRVEYVYEPR